MMNIRSSRQPLWHLPFMLAVSALAIGLALLQAMSADRGTNCHCSIHHGIVGLRGTTRDVGAMSGARVSAALNLRSFA